MTFLSYALSGVIRNSVCKWTYTWLTTQKCHHYHNQVIELQYQTQKNVFNHVFSYIHITVLRLYYDSFHISFILTYLDSRTAGTV